jgi:hypothetical protein
MPSSVQLRRNRRHLHKHRRAAERFLESVGSQEFSSEPASKYKKRFQKYSPKLFTFLDHDGVPWNNTNAEHAIKRFAKYRRDADGRFTERSLEEYLMLASVFETCEFKNVNVLEFLLSKETSIEGPLQDGWPQSKGQNGANTGCLTTCAG